MSLFPSFIADLFYAIKSKIKKRDTTSRSRKPTHPHSHQMSTTAPTADGEPIFRDTQPSSSMTLYRPQDLHCDPVDNGDHGHSHGAADDEPKGEGRERGRSTGSQNEGERGGGRGQERLYDPKSRSGEDGGDVPENVPQTGDRKPEQQAEVSGRGLVEKDEGDVAEQPQRTEVVVSRGEGEVRGEVPSQQPSRLPKPPVGKDGRMISAGACDNCLAEIQRLNNTVASLRRSICDERIRFDQAKEEFLQEKTHLKERLETLQASHIQSVNSVSTGLDPISDQSFQDSFRKLHDKVSGPSNSSMGIISHLNSGLGQFLVAEAFRT